MMPLGTKFSPVPMPSLFFLILQGALAQTQISGKVTDANGSPISGASISVKGGGASLTTDNGSFSVKLPAGKSSITVSYVGFVPKTVTVTGTTANVTLELDNKALSEVVVTGLGVATSKKKVAFAVEAVNLSNQVKSPTVMLGNNWLAKLPVRK